jgi:hypothetical protein
MFNDISWQNFIVFIASVSLVWYVTIGIVYYRTDLKTLFQFVRKRLLPSNLPVKNETVVSEELTDPFDAAQQARNEISQILERAAHHSFPKEEIIVAFKLCLRQYTQLKTTALRPVINNFISIESKNKCSTIFDEADLNQVWME